MGKSEVQLLQDMINCILSLIRMDKHKSLEKDVNSFQKKIQSISIDENDKPPPPVVHNTQRMDDVETRYKEIYKPAVKVLITKRDTPPIPQFIIDKFLIQTGANSSSAYEGRWIKCKLSKCQHLEDSDFRRQFTWIDPVTQTIHWRSDTDKKIDHKCLSIISAKSVDAITETFTGFIIKLSTGEELQIQLPSNWAPSEQADWAKVIGYIRSQRL